MIDAGRALAGEARERPKDGARFHFELPGSVQGFLPEESAEVRGAVSVENVHGHSVRGTRSLALRYRGVAPGRTARVATGCFVPSRETAQYFEQRGYALMASPTLSSGQEVSLALCADPGNDRAIRAGIYIRVYDADDALELARGPQIELAPGARRELRWVVPDTAGYPIAEVGVEIACDDGASGSLYLDFLTWDGEPDVTLTRTKGGTMWRRAWVNGVDHGHPRYPEPFRLIQDRGTGLLIHGTREWRNYRVSADVTPHMARSAGLAARVQGMRRYYALLLCSDGRLRLLKALDGTRVLAEREFAWSFGSRFELGLQVVENRILASIDGNRVFELEDAERPLESGAIALVCEDGRTATRVVTVEPAAP